MQATFSVGISYVRDTAVCYLKYMNHVKHRVEDLAEIKVFTPIVTSRFPNL